jgi:predicted nucleic acid-binding protein
LSVYFDANILVAILTSDALSSRTAAYLRTHTPAPVVSDFAAAEFASAVSRRVRMGELSRELARSPFANFDVWIMQKAMHIDVASADIRAADAMLRRLDSNLRAPRALGLALAPL